MKWNMNDNPPFRELMPSFYIVCTTVALFGKSCSLNKECSLKEDQVDIWDLKLTLNYSLNYENVQLDSKRLIR